MLRRFAVAAILLGSAGCASRFDFLRGTNMASGDGHMHEAVFDLSRTDAIRTAWTCWEDGKAGHTAVLEMKRVR